MNNSEIIALLKARRENSENEWKKNFLLDTGDVRVWDSLIWKIAELDSLIIIFEQEQKKLIDVASQKINIIGEE